MARLILLNGPPAAGKSTLARRWVDDHPLALNLDLDLIWSMLGRWQDDLTATGLAARELALAMAVTQLSAGRSVIVPQYLGRPEFVDQLASVAGEQFRHLVLLPSRTTLRERFRQRPSHPIADYALGPAEAGQAELDRMYDRLVELAGSHATTVLPVSDDEDIEESYRRLRRALLERQ